MTKLRLRSKICTLEIKLALLPLITHSSFDQVYQPCILQTKKRYVGYMYESADQQKPVYEAKGIETVRRDGCPAGVKVSREIL